MQAHDSLAAFIWALIHFIVRNTFFANKYPIISVYKVPGFGTKQVWKLFLGLGEIWIQIRVQTHAYKIWNIWIWITICFDLRIWIQENYIHKLKTYISFKGLI